MQKFEDTFRTGLPLDPVWLGVLNQVFAIACQIGGADVVEGDAYMSGKRFYQRSLAVLSPLLESLESIEVLQYLLLKGQYLQSTSQPTLCWNTIGHAIRFAQAQRLHLPSTYSKMNPLDAELKQRAWAGIVILEASTSATLGLPPSLSPEECLLVCPADVNDECILRGGIVTKPAKSLSYTHFFIETLKLYIVQMRTLRLLYSSVTVSTSKWPDAYGIIEVDRELSEWESGLRSSHLQYNGVGKEMRGGDQELEQQARRQPSLDILGAAPSLVDRALALASTRICCTAAVELIDLIVMERERIHIGAWWYQVYYVYSASLVTLSSIIVEAVASMQHLPSVIDLDRATGSLRIAEAFFSEHLGGAGSLYNHLPIGLARSIARSCSKNIRGIVQAIITWAEGRSDSTVSTALKTNLVPSFGELSPRASLSQGGSDDASPDNELFRAFLDLLPPSRPPTAQGERPALAPAYSQDRNGNETLMSSWSMRDLLLANCLPSQGFGVLQHIDNTGFTDPNRAAQPADTSYPWSSTAAPDWLNPIPESFPASDFPTGIHLRMYT
ncbi:MAG: hypothetical protein CYPHOPRED_000980 [Cyphobasidiales sp. Tagirdzhanova-0007]|nr:MAG: hypothetical protein CYPHOPRED_000980 [Cyphobasidiales sp. Tagirdzhanova-0007]